MNEAYKNYIESLDTIKLKAELNRQYAISSDCESPEGMRYKAYLRYKACGLLLGWKAAYDQYIESLNTEETKEHTIESAKRFYLSFWKRYLPWSQ